MTNIKTVEEFKERLVHLNTQLVNIEKNVTYKTDCLVCDQHQKFADPLTKFNDRLLQFKQTDWLQHATEKGSINQGIMTYFYAVMKGKFAK